MIYGFDVSQANGTHPFDKIETTDLEFVIIKAQQGNDGFDPDFEANAKAALAAGLIPFAYCFCEPLPAIKAGDGRSAVEQAQLFVSRLARYPEFAKKPIFLDCEWPAPSDFSKWGVTWKSIALWIRTCCEEIYRLTGVRPILYTYPDWWEHLLAEADATWALDYYLWIARYVSYKPTAENTPALLKPWFTWTFWQYDGNGGFRLPNGVDADMCAFNGTKDQLLALSATGTYEN